MYDDLATKWTKDRKELFYFNFSMTMPDGKGVGVVNKPLIWKTWRFRGLRESSVCSQFLEKETQVFALHAIRHH